MGLELWACDLRQDGNQALLRVYIDRENGVTLEDCTSVSREISAILDVEDPIKNRYQLEISSPGLERTLMTLSHFERYVGHNVKVKLRVAHANRRVLLARIEKIVGERVYLTVENETIGVTLGEIQKENLVS
jgi:ribosome maturation factor RimP